MKLPVIYTTAQRFTKRNPITRGMIVYSLLWPASNIFQQTFQKREKFNWYETLRFSFYGCFVAAPTIYLNVKFLSYLVPAQTFRGAVYKAILDQLMYAPFAVSSFYLGMSALEGKSWDEMVAEWKLKFIPTLKMGACIWPFVQILNFTFIKERNRVPVIGTVSFFWTTFLSYMKHLELRRIPT